MNPSLQLNDILLPDAIGVWPLAPGWWLLILLVIVTVIAVRLLVKWRIKIKHQQQPMKQALQQLQTLANQPMSPALCADINETLKIYCRQRCPQAVSLYGQSWADFLEATPSELNNEQYELLAHGPYRKKVSGNSQHLATAASSWLKARDKQTGAQHHA